VNEYVPQTFSLSAALTADAVPTSAAVAAATELTTCPIRRT
jgi:hypothetical protein